jgi:Zn-dependent protease/CBS domain-containing protein
MSSGFHLIRIAGIDVRVDWSLLIIFLLIFNSLAIGLFPAWHPDWTWSLTWLTALGAALLFFASVLVHELAHALVGKRMGVVISRITLFIFGGIAHVEREPGKWRSELWMAAAGPAMSFVVGFACLAIAGVLAGPLEMDADEPAELFAALGPVPTLLVWLGQVNIILAAFNLVPGFPLDGGRVLRALLWAYTGDLRRATRWASMGGQGFAWVLIGIGFAMMVGLRVPFFGAGLVNGLWLAFIGWFLNNAALLSYRQLLAREALQDVPVSKLMMTRFETTAPDTALRALIDEQMLRTGQHAFPVVEHGALRGIVCLRDIQRLDPAKRMTARVKDVMTLAEPLVRVRPDDDAYDALMLLAREGVNQLLVVEGEALRGMLRREDVLSWLALHGETADESSARQPQPS